MKQLALRFVRLILGLFLYALGITITLKANIGYAPWDVFHAGLVNLLGISFGLASIAAGITAVAAAAFLGERLGVGTILNMVLIGVFIDIILAIDVIPVSGGVVTGVVMLVAGLYIISLASFFYIGAGFGAGPRDSLMVALNRKTKLPVGVCRGAIEMAALACGWTLGGMVGIGTVISALGIGFCIQTTFRLLSFKPSEIKHETLGDTYKNIKQLLQITASNNK